MSREGLEEDNGNEALIVGDRREIQTSILRTRFYGR
jgi:hypothetical protein